MSGGLGPRSRGRRAPPRMAPPCWGWNFGAHLVAPSRRGGPGVSPPEKFRNFTCKMLNFGAHLRKIIYLLC
jgi:hypothetical protein